jgi:UDP-glucose:(heptosyl)LPS alpha-1,3-glucosyltransferase
VKIALVIFSTDPARGGAERYTFELAAGLARRGHEVDLVAARLGPPIDGVGAVHLPSRAATRAGEYLRFLAALDRHLESNAYDIVHSMLPVRTCDVYHPHAGMAKSSFDSNFLNRFNRKRKLYAQIEEKLLAGPRAPRVICLSDFVKTFVLKSYPDLGSRLEKLFNAVDLEKFNPADRVPAKRDLVGFGPEQIVGLMIAQHFQQKGLSQAIQALSASDKRLALCVVGRDNPAPARKLAEKLGVADRVVFAGTTDSPADFYAAADFFILPTSYDSCSLVVLESLAMGLPVISTVFNGACEIMTDGTHGYVFREPKDVPALADAMNKMVDPARRAAMRAAALALRPRLSYETHLDQLEKIYALSQRAH